MRIGGDGTFLRTSGLIEDSNTPILGLNTDPSRSIGFLCNKKIYNDMKEKHIKSIFEHLEQKNFEYFYRQRQCFHMASPLLKDPINKLVLNELFVAEKDVGKTSIYRLEVDETYLGKFKSSGIIVSTGTGSTGWLFSCRRIS
jgi:NAD+ kinase